MFGVAVKPPDGARKTYGGFNGRVSDGSEDPGHVVRVLFPKGFQIPYTHLQPSAIPSYERVIVRIFDSGGK